uniref:Uncharacterized protein n=1 Tax=Chromera velia CCMP2878 TaxID=1169474 RepID=A0A0G4F1D3_9ALVE|eukprot:Cvel_2621.t1-p1 / transcript=Cvel_2621.t1 / gene=Cvel_2621 / organism=Chromera_velia_CCMP2878 / gene_product=hypothetical protein / transcript_product=hypothetical protein / location=Cvel_scaffold104:14088-14606(-) / protein_length=173 / sequence_SO=supercontig / SO=protein_coding / is_pseudo=false
MNSESDARDSVVFLFDIAQLYKPAEEKEWLTTPNTFLSTAVSAIDAAGLQLCEEVWLEAAFAADGKPIFSSVRDFLHDGLECRGFDVDRRDYKGGRKEGEKMQAGVDCSVMSEGHAIIIKKAAILPKTGRLVFVLGGIEQDLKVLGEKIDKEVKLGEWVPAGLEVHVIMVGAS